MTFLTGMGILLLAIIMLAVVLAAGMAMARASGEDNANRVPCPRCGQMIVTPVERCPKCGAKLLE